MFRRPAALFALFPLFSCAGAPEKPAPVEEKRLEQFTYRAAVAAVPAGASELILSVELPEDRPAGALHALSAHGLVGNAPFDLRLSEGDASLTNELLSLSWVRPHSLRLTTRGKPAELSLRFGVSGVAGDTSELERELVRGTRASADDRPLETLATRLERLR